MSKLELTTPIDHRLVAALPDHERMPYIQGLCRGVRQRLIQKGDRHSVKIVDILAREIVDCWAKLAAKEGA